MTAGASEPGRAISPDPREGRAWYVISLRPCGGHGPLRRAAARVGARVVALSPWRIRPREDAPARSRLSRALAAPRVVFTSPAAVAAALRHGPLRRPDGAVWCAVGAGTAAALRRVGVDRVAHPERMDSEGLLGLPELRDVAGLDVALVTAPGGRGTLAPALLARGANVLRADVYQRDPIAPSPAAIARLREAPGPLAIALSSGEALQRVLDALPADLATRLRSARVLAASPRLAAQARALGFDSIALASGPRPAQLLSALASARPDIAPERSPR